MLPGGPDLAIVFAVALASGVIRGLSGFGTALVLVPVLALAVSPTNAVIVANILAVVLGITSYRGARHMAERSARTIALLAILATPAGLYLLSITPVPVARMVIAAVAMTALVAFLLPEPKLSDRHVGALAVSTGIAAGLIGGFAGMSGPPVIAFYIGRRVDKATARASMFVIFLATSLTACLTAVLLEMGDISALWLAAALTPVVLLGNWLGGLAFGKVSDLAWRLFAGVIVVGAVLAALKDVL